MAPATPFDDALLIQPSRMGPVLYLEHKLLIVGRKAACPPAIYSIPR